MTLGAAFSGARVRHIGDSVAVALPYAVMCAVLGYVCAHFYGRYAFDDSYFGYSSAQSLLEGRGFSFNGGDHFLSTSAPLAVPLYAFVAATFDTSVVRAAQLFSLTSFAAVLFGSFALLRIYCSRIGALCAALTLVSTPFFLPLWSHETLLYMASVVIGLLVYVRGYRTASAIILGSATLFRGEALMLLPFIWWVDARRGASKTLPFAFLTLLPYTLWAIAALWYFGTPFSSTIASKHAQLLYLTSLPYAFGAAGYALRLYGPVGAAVLTWLLMVTVGSSAVAGFRSRVYIGVGAWALAVTALYVVLELPFYFWFCTQLSVAIAVTVALPWSTRRKGQSPAALLVARAAALGIALVNISFAGTFLQGSAEYTTGGTFRAVEPSLAASSYVLLGRWFRQSGLPVGTIAYGEPGEIHYYSGFPVVDYLGIVTPGVAKHLENGNAVWALKRYRPRYVIEDLDVFVDRYVTGAQPIQARAFDLFVASPEYDWFRESYRRIATLHFPGANGPRSDFAVYGLLAPSRIPLADERESHVRVLAVDTVGDRAAFTFVALRPSEVETRLYLPAACGAANLRLAGPRVDSRTRRRLPAGITRVTVQLPEDAASGRYVWSIGGCTGIRLAPPPPETGFLWPRPVGPPRERDALVVYTRGPSR